MVDPTTQEIPEDVNVITAEDGTKWVEIASVGTEDEAKLLQGFLQAEGLEAQIEDVEFHMAPTTFGTMGDIRIYVKADDETRAQELLRKREEEYESLDDDEETLVTDEGPAEIDEAGQVESDDGAKS
jgi:hypothetical protein